MTDEDNVRGLLESLEEPTDVVDLSVMDDLELLGYHQGIRKALYDLDEMHGEPRSDEGRELHSRRAACMIELSRRGLR